jgi:hypothetical protein
VLDQRLDRGSKQENQHTHQKGNEIVNPSIWVSCECQAMKSGIANPGCGAGSRGYRIIVIKELFEKLNH